MKKKWIAFIALLLTLFVIWLFRVHILQQFANILISEDEIEKADAIVVLSGNAFERGAIGSELFSKGISTKIICPGGNIDYNHLVLTGDSVCESEFTRMRILKQQIPDSAIIVIKEGSSTMEEAQSVLKFCKANKINSVIVVSSLFHTARAKMVFSKVLGRNNIKVIVRGAKSPIYDEKFWWRSEYGLIGFNNEFIKLIYYCFK